MSCFLCRVTVLLTLVLVLNLEIDLQAKERPNFLIIMADDCTYNDLPVYGGKNAKTPNIDRLASQGLVFDRAYLTSAMCQPCRAELYTGQFPMRNGCAWNHSASRPDTTSMPQHLSKLGYRVGLAGKVHVKPETAFPFESVSGFEKNCVRNPTRDHDLNGVATFINEDDGQPFCLVVALVEPHVPWVMGDASKYPPEKIQLPPNLADTQRTREDYGRYLAEITYMDGQVGEILRTLDLSGKANETVVFFTSEQGSQFPGCKWTNWDTGLHTALIARWPGRITPRQRTNAMVHYADVLPTLLELGDGVALGEGFDGMSFQEVLSGEANSHRSFVFGMHNNVPEGPPYPIRSVYDGEYHYIRNLEPDEIYIEKHLMGVQGDGRLNNPYWATWVSEASANEATYQLVKRYTRRPSETLYHTATDPYEMNNRIDQEDLGVIRDRLSKELDKWMNAQGDPGAAQDSLKSLQASRRGQHLFVPPSE
ncbi:MAG: sulfatase [Verrucomicrobia bacterium]|jgi:N-sulfoglucosamine sulfohydrolase|nr:sulfatase [Verrucomicrobiota bacterium]